MIKNGHGLQFMNGLERIILKSGAIKCLLTLILAVSYAGIARGEFKTVYTLSVQPRYTPIETSHNWTPLLARIEKDCGLSFQLRQYDSMRSFEADLMKGIPDFAYLNPYHMVLAKRTQNYLPVLRDKLKFHALLLVSNDSSIQNLADLSGKTVAFPDPAHFATSVYMRYMLNEKEKIEIKPVFTGKPQNALRTVLKGEADAASAATIMLQRELPEVTSRFRIIYTTPDLVNFPIAANPRIPEAVRKNFLSAMLGLSRDAEGQKLLDAIQISTPVAADYKRDYQALEKLRLERYTKISP